MKGLQMIPITADYSLFITGYNEATGELSFRTSNAPERIQTEQIEINDNMVYTSLYHFHVNYLGKFIQENTIKTITKEK